MAPHTIMAATVRPAVLNRRAPQHSAVSNHVERRIVVDLAGNDFITPAVPRNHWRNT